MTAIAIFLVAFVEITSVHVTDQTCIVKVRFDHCK